MAARVPNMVPSRRGAENSRRFREEFRLRAPSRRAARLQSADGRGPRFGRETRESRRMARSLAGICLLVGFASSAAGVTQTCADWRPTLGGVVDLDERASGAVSHDDGTAPCLHLDGGVRQGAQRERSLHRAESHRASGWHGEATDCVRSGRRGVPSRGSGCHRRSLQWCARGVAGAGLETCSTRTSLLAGTGRLDRTVARRPRGNGSRRIGEHRRGGIGLPCVTFFPTVAR